MNRTQEIARVVNTVATARGETQRDVAKVIGVDPATITRRVRQGKGSWTAEDLEALGKHYNVPTATFLQDMDDLWDALIARYAAAA
jgi:transcriptional regulator with XRE-family HTH domain